MRNILATVLLGSALAGAVPASAATYTVSVNLAQQAGTLSAFDTSLGTLTSVTGTGVVGIVGTTYFTLFPTTILTLSLYLSGGAYFQAGGASSTNSYSPLSSPSFGNFTNEIFSGSNEFAAQAALPRFSIDPSLFGADLAWSGYVYNSFFVLPNTLIGNAFINGINQFSYGSVDLLFTYEAATAAVPEPATWAMMLLGFGGTGALLRRKRNRLAPAA